MPCPNASEKAWLQDEANSSVPCIWEAFLRRFSVLDQTEWERHSLSACLERIKDDKTLSHLGINLSKVESKIS